MDRRIRVKCPECAASIELLVDLEELLDVKCPRCQNLFTAKVPPPVLEIVPVEVEPVEETPPVRFTRVVQPKSASRPKGVRQTPAAAPAPNYFDNTWTPPAQYGSASRVTGATHIKAILIATGSIVSLGLLVMAAVMINSSLSKMDWSSGDTTVTSPPSGTDSIVSNSGQPDSASIASIDSPTSAAESEYVSDLDGETASGVADPTSPSSSNPSTAASGSKPEGSKPEGSMAEKIILLANQIADATKDGDNEFIIDRTHPKLVELAGGRTKMLELLNKALEPMKTQGISIANFSVSKDVVVRQVGQKVFAILPTTLDLKYPNRTMRTDGFLLAVSEDGGKTFTFIDGAGAAKNRAVLKQILPDLPDDLALPAAGIPREVPQ